MHYSAWFSSRVFFTLLELILQDELVVIPGKESIRVLEIGSASYNGDMKSALYSSSLPTSFDVQYIGLDFDQGPNVDIVVSPKDKAYPYPDNSISAIITSSALEHDPRFWMTFLKMLQVLQPGGFIYINVPYEWQEHKYPIDCWRFYGDAGTALESWGQDNGYNVKLVYTSTLPRYLDQGVDTVMIFHKVMEGDRGTSGENDETVSRIVAHFSRFLEVYAATVRNPYAYVAFARNTNAKSEDSDLLAEIVATNGLTYYITNDYNILVPSA